MNEKNGFFRHPSAIGGAYHASLYWLGILLMLPAMAAHGGNDNPTYMPQHCVDVVNGLRGGVFFKFDFFKQWPAFLREYGDKGQQPEMSGTELEAYFTFLHKNGVNLAKVDAERLKPLQSLLTNSDNFWHGPMSIVGFDEAALDTMEGAKRVVILFSNSGARVFEDGTCLYNGALFGKGQDALSNWENQISGNNQTQTK